ncbi:ABC transporter type 1, transmembrane domain-containing protein [Lactifluus subvellereus]|nr:ABC transporter type 1, transmembrane domain-containing protein [Lactifluus subvellereus]
MSVELDDNNKKATPPPRNGRFSWLKSKQKRLDKLNSDSSSLDLAISAPLEKDPKPVSFTSLFRFTTRTELTLNGIGLVAAVAAGAAQDFINFTVATQNINPNDPQSSANADEAARKFRNAAAKDASYLIHIGVGTFVCTYIYMCIWVYTAEVAAKRIRERYLRAILRQDITFFDKVGPGEVTTRIQTDTHLVQQGLSEKVALTVTFISTFVTGFVLAFARNWRLALAMSSILPCIATTGALMNKFMSKYIQ